MNEESCKVATETELQMHTSLLESNTTYCIHVFAHNSVGNSTGSELLIVKMQGNVLYSPVTVGFISTSKLSFC